MPGKRQEFRQGECPKAIGWHYAPHYEQPECWGYEIPQPRVKKKPGHPYAKLTEDDVRSIRKERNIRTIAWLAAKYNVSGPTISNVVNGKTWTTVK